ncbi:D-alanyl-D-alanine carboxypeptidase family protein [Longirhabdus pacifica]|uniref:D-alanyl-D-alanine carboxypeptidase family protein n=1 Tax=Longirhabdus pacifica TaxID=2305227 RepID=UPI00100920AF|nr:D-alanyl-D-alanine carboxypeptidase family protein [Longirhabdus pacifica]
MNKIFNKTKWKKITATVLIFQLLHMFLLSSFFQTHHVQAQTDITVVSDELKSAVLMDAMTGQILYAKNADAALPPASMSKMMTEYLLLESVANGQLAWEQTITISKYASDMIGSGQQLAEGRQYTVKDVYRQLAIYSGNDASIALAEAIAGTEEQFVNMMNSKAKELGLSDQTYFANSTGLNNSELREYSALAPNVPNVPGETLLTANDAALLARNLIVDFPEVLETTSITEANVVESDPTSLKMVNWNWMLEGWKEYNNNFTEFAYEGLDGLKTGHTDEAGYCFTGTAERDGMRLISVVMGAGSEPERFRETKKLLDYGFNNFEKKTIVKAKSTLEQLTEVEIKKGVETKVPVVTETSITLLVGKQFDEATDVTIEAVALPEDIVAPIETGQKVGTVTVKYTSPSGEIVETVNLIAEEEVEKAGWFRLFLRAIKNFFVDIFEGVKNLF